MAAEAGYLGTPSIYLDNEGRGYTNYLSKYNLVYNFTESSDDQRKSIQKGIEILAANDKKVWLQRSRSLANDCIDVGEFMIWFIEKYPESAHIMRENPNYQRNFKRKWRWETGKE